MNQIKIEIFLRVLNKLSINIYLRLIVAHRFSLQPLGEAKIGSDSNALSQDLEADDGVS